jgi:hypothetical protein
MLLIHCCFLHYMIHIHMHNDWNRNKFKLDRSGFLLQTRLEGVDATGPGAATDRGCRAQGRARRGAALHSRRYGGNTLGTTRLSHVSYWGSRAARGSVEKSA